MKFSGFMNVYQQDDMSWKYVHGDKSHVGSNLKELEFLVRMHGLKWGILDKDLAKKAIEADKLNRTGFLNVYIRPAPTGNLWCYRGSDLTSTSLEVLKKKVLNEGLEWKVTDDDLANKSFNLDLKKFNAMLF